MSTLKSFLPQFKSLWAIVIINSLRRPPIVAQSTMVFFMAHFSMGTARLGPHPPHAGRLRDTSREVPPQSCGTARAWSVLVLCGAKAHVDVPMVSTGVMPRTGDTS